MPDLLATSPSARCDAPCPSPPIGPQWVRFRSAAPPRTLTRQRGRRRPLPQAIKSSSGLRASPRSRPPRSQQRRCVDRFRSGRWVGPRRRGRTVRQRRSASPCTQPIRALYTEPHGSVVEVHLALDLGGRHLPARSGRLLLIRPDLVPHISQWASVFKADLAALLAPRPTWLTRWPGYRAAP
jgi:hypothetical protein